MGHSGKYERSSGVVGVQARGGARRLLVKSARLARARTAGLARLGPAGVVGMAALALALPAAAAGQEASIGGLPSPGGPGLPDGRAYELVSPIETNGNEAGAFTFSSSFNPINVGYSYAAADGEALLYETNGPMGAQVESGAERLAISRRTRAGWQTTGALPAPVPGERSEPLAQGAGGLDPSANLERLVFEAFGSYAAADPANGTKSDGAFLTGQDIAQEAEWVSAPGEPLTEALPEPGKLEAVNPLMLVGGSPNLEVVYFSYFGTLLPEDASRKPYIESDGGGPWGFYERRDGVLKAVGVLPASSPVYPGKLDPHGAVPAGPFDHESSNPDAFDNTVSEDGQRAFFVSPDPNASTPPPEGDPSELYVRENGERTLLISRDELTGGGPAPGYELSLLRGIRSRVNQGITPTHYPLFEGETEAESFAYAAPDGSRVFFVSEDRLTSAAPANTEQKTYEFNLEAEGGKGSLTYLPGVVGPILASSRDGSRFLFEDTSSSPQRLELWEETPGGAQQITEVAQFSQPSVAGFEPVRATASGSEFVFETNAELDPGSFKNGGEYTQVYRYTAPSEADPSGQLACISCLAGTAPASGDARLSNATRDQPGTPQAIGLGRSAPVGTRGISANGNRIFFDTPQPLLPEAVNGQRDVYEWEAPGEGSCPVSQASGCLYLISSGTSAEPAMFLDNSESGDDVFFASAEPLVPGENPAGYAVYDAREPHLPGEPVGFAPTPTPAPCSGGDCQSEAAIEAAPAPALLSNVSGPSGNLVPPKAKPRKVRAKNERARKLAKALKRCRRRFSRDVRRRSTCDRRARHRYGARSAARGARAGREAQHRGRRSIKTTGRSR